MMRRRMAFSTRFFATALMVALSATLGLAPTAAVWAKTPSVPTTCCQAPTASGESIISAIVPNDLHLAETLTLTFRHRFKAVLDDARQQLSRPHAENAAVVIDLDETLLDNRAYFMLYKHYVPTLWDRWVERADAPVIPESRAFFDWVRQEGYAVYFVTGRPEHLRRPTEINLKQAGVVNYTGLMMKPSDYDKASAANYKVSARKRIEQQGHPIVMVVGDQYSDLKGAEAMGVKLPNPVYFIP